MPNGCKIDQKPIKIQHLPLQDPRKITQIWIFGMKIYHLATLIRCLPMVLSMTVAHVDVRQPSVTAIMHN
jgi:hypothetical protein